MAARSTLTVTSGTVITSAWGNSVRDHAVPFTTSDDVTSNGQLAFNTTTNRLVGRIGGTAFPVAGAMPRARVRRSATTTFSSGANFSVPWNTEDYDTDSIWASGSPGLLTASHSGLWLVTYSATITGGISGGVRAAFIEKTADATRHGSTNITTGSGDFVEPSFSSAAVIQLDAGQAVQLVLYTTVSSPSVMTTGAGTDYFQMYYLGPA